MLAKKRFLYNEYGKRKDAIDSLEQQMQMIYDTFNPKGDHDNDEYKIDPEYQELEKEWAEKIENPRRLSFFEEYEAVLAKLKMLNS
jgi:hypothetical protein